MVKSMCCIEIRRDEESPINTQFVERVNHSGRPFLQRFVVQFSEIFKTNCIDLNSTQISSVQSNLMTCAEEFISLENLINEYISIMNDFIAMAQDKEQLKFEAGGWRYKNPTLRLHKIFKDFLIQAIIIYRKILKNADIVFEEELSNSHKKLKKKLEDTFNSTDLCYTDVMDLTPWVVALYDLRGNAEHKELNLTNLVLVAKDLNNISIGFPKLEDEGQDLLSFTNEAIEKLFVFCEKFTVMLINKYVHKGMQLYERNTYVFDENAKYYIDLDSNGLQSLEECIIKNRN